MSGTTIADPGRETRRDRGAGEERRRRRSKGPQGVTWVLPALVLCVGLIYYCIAYTGYISTLDWDGISPDPEHVGLGNYSRIVHDPVFWAAIRHTVVFFAVTFVVQTFLGFLFAVLLHSRIKFAVVYKVLIFIPVVLAPAITAPVFRKMLAPDGQLNWVLHHVGLSSLEQPWIGQTSTALPVIMAITVWQFTGITFVLYFAAMSQIEPSVLEAARMDGAGNIRTISSIIWPSVRGTTLALAILSAIGVMKTFDIPWLVTTAGPNQATEFLGTYIYRMAIPQAHVGYGAALSVILLVVALIMAVVLQLRSREKGATS